MVVGPPVTVSTYAEGMPLGTSYPASSGAPPRPRQSPTSPTPGSPTPPAPRSSPTSPTPGDPRPSTTPAVPLVLSTEEQMIRDYGAISKAQQDALMGQYLGAMGMGELGYDNNAWFRQAQAANDLARLGLQADREVGLGRERNSLDRMFAGRAFDIDSRGNALTRDMRYRANESEAAARGSITSGGFGQNNRDILGQFGIAQDTTQLEFDRRMADANISDKALDSLGKEFGLRKADIENALKFGMTQLGLDWIGTVQQLNADLESGNSAIQQNALNFMTQVLALPIEGPKLTDFYNADGTPKMNPGMVARQTAPGNTGNGNPMLPGTMPGNEPFAPGSNRVPVLGQYTGPLA